MQLYLVLQDEDNLSSGSKLQDQEENGGFDDQSISGEGEDSISRSSENQSSADNSYHGSDDELNSTRSDSEKNLVLPKSGDDLQKQSEYSRNMNTHDVPISEGAPFTSDANVWQAPEMPHSYYDSAGTNEYTTSELSLANPQINGEQQTRLINIESNLGREESNKELLHRQSDNGSFNSYPNQDRSDLLQSLFKGEGVLSYHHEQKGVGLDFQTPNNVMIGDGQFSGHFKEPLPTSLTLDQVHRRGSEVFMPENVPESIYSDGGGRYLIPRQDQLSTVNLSDWTVNATHLSAPPQSHLSAGRFIGQHWFPADHQVRGAWNGSEGGGNLSSQGLGTGGNSDQSLFSVLSQCNQLRPTSSYDPVRHTDQFLTTRSYGAVEAGTPRMNAVVPQTSHPLDYLSGREGTSPLLPDDMAWMNLPHQNSALHDQMGRPFLRSWNR